MLATLAQRWRIRVTNDPQPHASFTLRPKGGVMARAELRTSVTVDESQPALAAV
jgi:hypothetical protein